MPLHNLSRDFATPLQLGGRPTLKPTVLGGGGPGIPFDPVTLYSATNLAASNFAGLGSISQLATQSGKTIWISGFEIYMQESTGGGRLAWDHESLAEVGIVCQLLNADRSVVLNQTSRLLPDIGGSIAYKPFEFENYTEIPPSTTFWLGYYLINKQADNVGIGLAGSSSFTSSLITRTNNYRMLLAMSPFGSQEPIGDYDNWGPTTFRGYVKGIEVV